MSQSSDAPSTPTPSAPPSSGGLIADLGRHPTGFWFFFWGEFAERCSYYGMRAILALYMIDRLGMSEADSGQYMALFMAACYLLPLVGGWLADNFLGRYWTIVGFSIPYILGQFLVGLEDPYLVTIALALLAMGSGVIKPNISTLMGMTYDQQRPGEKQLRSDAFQLFYMAINIGAAISQFAMPVLRSQFGYFVAFLFPAVFMCLALGLFAAGKRFYAVEKPRERDGTPEDAGQKLLVLSRIGALFLLVTFFWGIFDQSASTWIFFANTYMTGPVLGIDFSADQMQFFNPVFIVLFTPLTMLLWRVLANAGLNVRPTDKMFAGFVLTTLTMGIMAYAGYLAPKADQVLQLATKEIKIILPMQPAELSGSKNDIKTGKVSFEKGEIAFDSTSRLIINKGTSNGGKITFRDGELRTAEGTLFFKDGRLDIFASQSLFPEGPVKTFGLESRLEPGSYPISSGKELSVTGSTAKIVEVQPKETPAKPDERTISISEIRFVPKEKRISLWWQVLAYLVLTIAELLISVVGLELAYAAAPPSMVSFVTACWLFTVFLANILIHKPAAAYYPSMEPGLFFAILTGAMVVCTIAFVFIAKQFNRT